MPNTTAAGKYRAVISRVGALMLASAAALALAAAGPVTAHASDANSQGFTFNDTTQYFTVPAGVHAVHLRGWGGSGGHGGYGTGQYPSPGGLGAQLSLSAPVSPGDTLVIEIGGKGGNASGGVNGAPMQNAGAGANSSGSGQNGGPGGNINFFGDGSAGAGGGGGTVVVDAATGTTLLDAGGGGGGGGGWRARTPAASPRPTDSTEGPAAARAARSTAAAPRPTATGTTAPVRSVVHRADCAISRAPAPPGSADRERRRSAKAGRLAAAVAARPAAPAAATGVSSGGGGAAGTSAWASADTDVTISNAAPGDGGVVVSWTALPAVGFAHTVSFPCCATQKFTVPAGAPNFTSLAGVRRVVAADTARPTAALYAPLGGFGAEISLDTPVTPGDQLVVDPGSRGANGTFATQRQAGDRRRDRRQLRVRAGRRPAAASPWISALRSAAAPAAGAAGAPRSSTGRPATPCCSTPAGAAVGAATTRSPVTTAGSAPTRAARSPTATRRWALATRVPVPTGAATVDRSPRPAMTPAGSDGAGPATAPSGPAVEAGAAASAVAAAACAGLRATVAVFPAAGRRRGRQLGLGRLGDERRREQLAPRRRRRDDLMGRPARHARPRDQ